MIVLGIVLGTVALHLYVGLARVAPIFIKRSMEDHVRLYPTLAEDAVHLARWRKDAAAEAMFVAFIWPFYIAVSGLRDHLANAAPLIDHEREIRYQQALVKIEQLEKEQRELSA
ncbi:MULTISPECIES: hypothetical protein [Streptosporangium]|uniref:Uncharacterized protein n=1 Tax=Streptosporangium brasiliense TaxID=47480 RepID=A0ABT9RM43_9ACTN|nr:hypothetical protein [Streptosporangium brasiliense]MDP9870342.1 hypothetical protein [Streptosporangium brasiliense]